MVKLMTIQNNKIDPLKTERRHEWVDRFIQCPPDVYLPGQNLPRKHRSQILKVASIFLAESPFVLKEPAVEGSFCVSAIVDEN